jgi:orotate phosphoribosyltransferase
MIISDKQYQHYEKIMRNFIQEHCIVKKTMPGKLPGTTYTWMFYLRNGLFNADFLQYASEMMLYRLYEEIGSFKFQICGAETAGTPLAASLPLIAKMNNVQLGSFVVRKEQKKYGLMNWHEGMVFKDIPYVLIDDLCNSSMSLKHADDICRNKLMIPSTNVAIVLVNKVNKEIHSEKRTKTDMYLPEDVKVISLFDLDSFDLSNPSH